MNAATLIVIVLLAAMIVLAVISIARHRNRCSCCPLKDTCSRRR